MKTLRLAPQRRWFVYSVMGTVCGVMLWVVAFASASPVSGQTPLSTVNTGGGNDEAGFISANNPWLGAQIGVRLSDTGDFTDVLLVSARLMYQIEFSNPRFSVPVMGNVSSLKPRLGRTGTTASRVESQIQKVLQSTDGVHLGFYPYYRAIEGERFGLTVHGAMTYKLNSFEFEGDADSGLPPQDDVVYLHQARLAGGVEVFLGRRGDGHYPFTLSITPTVSLFSPRVAERALGRRMGALPQLETTFIMPVAGGLGLLVESIFSPDAGPTYRAGVMFATELGL